MDLWPVGTIGIIQRTARMPSLLWSPKAAPALAVSTLRCSQYVWCQGPVSSLKRGGLSGATWDGARCEALCGRGKAGGGGSREALRPDGSAGWGHAIGGSRGNPQGGSGQGRAEVGRLRFGGAVPRAALRGTSVLRCGKVRWSGKSSYGVRVGSDARHHRVPWRADRCSFLVRAFGAAILVPCAIPVATVRQAAFPDAHREHGRGGREKHGGAPGMFPCGGGGGSTLGLFFLPPPPSDTAKTKEEAVRRDMGRLLRLKDMGMTVASFRPFVTTDFPFKNS
ncbi:uncharacterized protein LOC121058020 [Cygnus olor]|uniref:uncharacterized protein LOC121058020 n=1 Tax=Cygnus olor TaxID=8869 RepID=UPI001ADEAF78|nr:uncharacterized protein LOC121058020 [Cygnus olor]